MYVRRRTIRQYAGFSTEESNAFIDVILLQDKRTIDRLICDTPWVSSEITHTERCVCIIVLENSRPSCPCL
jgi:hypothetical protein